jgi:hypothetical protein
MAERGCHLVRRSVQGHVKRVTDELPDAPEDLPGLERCHGPESAVKCREEPVDRPCVGTELDHRAPVQLEVADVASVDVLVRLLGQHDLHDEPAVVSLPSWPPGQGHRGHLRLQALEQREEVPHGEHVVFHEDPQPVLGRDPRVEGVVDQLGTYRVELGKRGHLFSW